MTVIHDRTLSTYDGKGSVLVLKNVNTVAIHRISLAQKSDANPWPVSDAELDGPALVRKFASGALGKITGFRPPYHILIRANPTATIEQVLPLLVRGAHCKGWNSLSWAIGVVGDHRSQPPSDAQWNALRSVCDLLCCGFREIRAHTDGPTGLAPASTKSCPGKFLPLEPLIAKVMRCIQPPLDLDPHRALELAGFRM